ncbi:MAG: hypothetical protein ACD_75C01945G0001, partial [uncultured bacterium]
MDLLLGKILIILVGPASSGRDVEHPARHPQLD